MRSSALLCLLPVALCAAASPSPANVTISNAATANMTCSGGVCSPTAVDAVLNVQDVAAMLASGNATVTTTGAGVQAADIEVKAPLTWSAGTTLALDAFQSIEVNSHVTVAGAGNISLTTNDGGSRGDFACNGAGRVEFRKFSRSLTNALTINGQSYVLVNSVAALAIAVANNPAGAFALAANYNAKNDGTYTWSPIGTTFTGSFNGLGNAISNLSVNAPTQDGDVGLFAETNDAMIANVRLLNESVQAVFSGDVGGLVGIVYGGAISHSLTTGAVSGGGFAGGLFAYGGSTVTGSGSTATVSGGEWGAGGLIASAYWGSISDSWATGNVSSQTGYVGGLVGLSQIDIKHSWASGTVTATGDDTVTGGLVGEEEDGAIERSHATGAVTCLWVCGGLVGYAEDLGSLVKISQSWATGIVRATSQSNSSAGGLVGYSEDCSHCEIVDSYATGSAGGAVVGGLLGANGDNDGRPSISGAYAAGTVSSTDLSGGLIGYDFANSHLKHTYWDRTTSGITNRSQGAGDPANDPGIKGLTDKELKSGLPKGFNPKIWKEDSSINGGLPYLINNPPPN